jgi:hypothetical protein
MEHDMSRTVTALIRSFVGSLPIVKMRKEQ